MSKRTQKEEEECFYLSVKTFLYLYVKVQSAARAARHKVGRVYRGFIDLEHSTRQWIRSHLRRLRSLANTLNLSREKQKELWRKSKNEFARITFSDKPHK